MAVITINGVEMPAPSDMQIGIMDLSKAERNANGTMIIERIATKRKIELSWNYLSRTQLSSVLNMVNPVFFTVGYQDPMTGASRSGTFYVGDRSASVIDFIAGVPRYKDVKFNFIER